MCQAAGKTTARFRASELMLTCASLLPHSVQASSQASLFLMDERLSRRLNKRKIYGIVFIGYFSLFITMKQDEIS